MTPTRIADYRSSLPDLAQARICFAQIAQAECRIAMSQARLDNKVARARARMEEETAEDRALIEALSEDLSAYVAEHPDQFQKPRKITTPHGSFGRQTVTDLVVEDEDAAIAHCQKEGLNPCYKTTTTLVKSVVKKLLKAGRHIPGVRLRSGDTAIIKVDRELLKAAAREATQ